MSRQAAFAWVSYLEAACLNRGQTDELSDFANESPFIVSLVDLPNRRVLSASEKARALFPAEVPCGIDSIMKSLSVSENEIQTSFLELIQNGVFDSFSTSKPVRRPDGSVMDAYHLVVAANSESVLWLIVPIEQLDVEETIVAGSGLWPRAVAGSAMGSFNFEWRLRRVSADLEDIVGLPYRSLPGESLIELVHQADLPSFVSAVAQALVQNNTVQTLVRLRHTHKLWMRVRVSIAPVFGDEMLFAFRADTTPEETQTDSNRAAELEQRLRNIAHEIRVLGLGPDLSLQGGLVRRPYIEKLTARQREIIGLLMQGRRVPRIAELLFISQSTVRNHLSAIYAKIGVASQSELLELVQNDGDEKETPAAVRGVAPVTVGEEVT